MEEVIVTVAGLGLAVAIPLFILWNERKAGSENLKQFYKAVDDIRDMVYAAGSKAEASELLDDLHYIEQSFENIVPKLVMEKELDLIRNLINKRSKKLK